MEKIINITSNGMLLDLGGTIDLAQYGTVVTYQDKLYTYKASGFCRDVFLSEDKKTVLKLPKKLLYDYAMQHIKNEVDCYNEAPDYMKKYIAQCYLTKDGFEIQEAVEVFDANYTFRELGRKPDGTIVVFDCDVFCDRIDISKKPDEGFRYSEIFMQLPTDFFKEWSEASADYIQHYCYLAANALKERYYPADIVFYKHYTYSVKFYVLKRNGEVHCITDAFDKLECLGYNWKHTF